MSAVLIFISSLQGGGAERVATSIANNLVSEQIRVNIVTLSSKQVQAYTLNDGVEWTALDLYKDSSGVFSSLANNAKRVWSVRQSIKLFEPTIILSFLPECNVTALIAAMGTKIPVVVSERNYPPMDITGKQWRILRKFTYKRAKAVVGVSKEISDWLERNIRLNNTLTITNSVNWPLEIQEPIVDPSSYSANRKIVFATGRLANQKGFDLLIDAFAKIASHNSDWVLCIAGGSGDDAAYRQYLEGLVRARSMESQIVFLGRVGNITDWYKAAEIFVLSSRFEGFPNVLLEAMASNTAVLSFDCRTGPAEIIDHMVNGLLVREGDMQHFHDELKMLMDNEPLRKKLAATAGSVRDDFSLESKMLEWKSVLGLSVEIKGREK